jgi:hypothetical protein
VQHCCGATLSGAALLPRHSLWRGTACYGATLRGAAGLELENMLKTVLKIKLKLRGAAMVFATPGAASLGITCVKIL